MGTQPEPPRPEPPRESSVVVDPLSQIPDAPRIATAQQKRQSEATLVLRGRRADALRDRVVAEQVRAERMKKAKVAGFAVAALVALGGGAYLARLSNAPDELERADQDSLAAEHELSGAEEGSKAQAVAGGEVRVAPEEPGLDADAREGGADEPVVRPREASAAASTTNQAQKRSDSQQSSGAQPEVGVLTLDQLPTAD